SFDPRPSVLADRNLRDADAREVLPVSPNAPRVLPLLHLERVDLVGLAVRDDLAAHRDARDAGRADTDVASLGKEENRLEIDGLPDLRLDLGDGEDRVLLGAELVPSRFYNRVHRLTSEAAWDFDPNLGFLARPPGPVNERVSC